jgi:hypothetical protein
MIQLLIDHFVTNPVPDIVKDPYLPNGNTVLPPSVMITGFLTIHAAICIFIDQSTA